MSKESMVVPFSALTSLVGRHEGLAACINLLQISAKLHFSGEHCRDVWLRTCTRLVNVYEISCTRLQNCTIGHL